MNYIIGLDGGGTKTKCIIADETGKPVLETSGGPSGILSTGAEKAASNILELINSGINQLNASIVDVRIILAGVAGAGRKFHADQLKDLLLSKLPEGFDNVFIESDARIALEGALAGEPGAVLIAGTGSVIFGKDDSGKIHRAGGLGRVIGDEGSGYSIGVKTLRLISNMIDGRKSAGKILDRFKDIFHINSEDDLINLVHNPDFDIASLAIFTIKNADEGIGEAKEILEKESEELINLIKIVKSRMKTEILKLVLAGSLLENNNYYSQLLIERIKELKNVDFVERKYSPEMGAVIMARKILAAKKSHQ